MVLPSWTRPVLVSSLPSTDVDIAFFVEGEVGSGERAVLASALVPDRDMRRDALSNQPTEELTGAIGRISSETVRFKSQSFLGSRDHRLRRRDFVIGAGGSSLHIDDHGVLNVDQIIEPITELHALVGLRRPGRARIDRRDHLRQLAIGVPIFVIERREELDNRAGLTLWP